MNDNLYVLDRNEALELLKEKATIPKKIDYTYTAMLAISIILGLGLLITAVILILLAPIGIVEYFMTKRINRKKENNNNENIDSVNEG
jgi:hypothetical protein